MVAGHRLDEERRSEFGRRYRAAARGASTMQALDSSACALGGSIANAKCEGAYLAASLEWVASRFDRCSLLVGDWSHRLTLQLSKGLAEDEARARALQDGRDAEEAAQARISRGRCRFSILMSSALASTRSYRRALDSLGERFAASPEFAGSVRRDATAYLGRRARRANADPLAAPERDALSCRGVLEDLALCVALVEEVGVRILAFPGDRPAILAALADPRHALALPALARFTFVPLRFRARPPHD